MCTILVTWKPACCPFATQISFCFMENQLKQPPTLSSKDSPQRSMGFSKGCGYCTLCKCMQSKLEWPLYLVTEQAPLRCLPGDIVASIFRVCWSRMCLCRALLWGWAFKHFGHSILACRAALEFPELFFCLSLVIKGRDTLTLEWVLRCTVIAFFSSQIWKQ